MTMLPLAISCVVAPIVLIAFLVFLVKWLRSQNYCNAALAVFFAACLSIACFFLLDLLWVHSLFTNYQSEAIVTGHAVEIVENSWWSENYGDEYIIGDDRFIQSFCVPYKQFALVELQWDCPLKRCTGHIISWDCGHRDICQEDCVVNADDGYYDGNSQYNCYNVNGDDDDANADDDANDDAGATTEEDLLTCAADSYVTDSTLSIYTDCSRCSVLTEQDYKWTNQDEEPPYLVISILSSTGILAALASLFLYFRRGEELEDKEMQLMESEDDDEHDYVLT